MINGESGGREYQGREGFVVRAGLRGTVCGAERGTGSSGSGSKDGPVRLSASGGIEDTMLTGVAAWAKISGTELKWQ